MSDPTAAGANAAVLGRLWGALAREPIDGIRHRRRTGADLVVTLADGRKLRGPAGAAQPYAHPPDHLLLDGAPHREPGPLLDALFHRISLADRPDEDAMMALALAVAREQTGP